VKIHDKQTKDLTRRHIIEAQFSDSVYQKKQNSPRHYTHHPTSIIYTKMREMSGDITGKRVLEYGCGTGWITLDLASRGGIIDSFDISPVAIDRTKNLIEKYGFGGNCTVQKMSAESLIYDDNLFDIVFGFAILHHLDLRIAIPELYRVLKPAGIAFFAEPLGSNPLINLYRVLTPQYRTPDEKPIILNEFMAYTKQFKCVTHQEVYLTALVAFTLLYLPFLKKYFRRLVDMLMSFDNLVLGRYPSLGKWAWYTIVTLTK